MTALVCAFFTSFTGASGVTILALGGLLMPVLLAARYSERNALGLLTSAGSLGLLFPPCLPLIFYAIVASNIAVNMGAASEVTIQKMFLGGIVPGALLVGLTAWWGVRVGPRADVERVRFNAAEARRAAWDAKWELLLPVVALGSLFSGKATPVEAAAITPHAAGVALAVPKASSAIPELLRRLDGNGVRIAGLQMSQPSLDDVFMKYTGRRIRAESADQPIILQYGV